MQVSTPNMATTEIKPIKVLDRDLEGKATQPAEIPKTRGLGRKQRTHNW